jgi:AraC-like DNA-binding protein
LIEDVRDALSSDLEVARRCLDRLSAVVNARSPGPTGQTRSPLPLVKKGGPVKGGLASWQIRKIDEHVTARLQTTISIGTLSDLTRLSSGHFCRAFKISMGETPHSYIRRARIERAQTMMMTSGASLSQIALACGLADQAHLTRLFRKYVGQTPLSWRRTWKTEA